MFGAEFFGITHFGVNYFGPADSGGSTPESFGDQRYTGFGTRVRRLVTFLPILLLVVV